MNTLIVAANNNEDTSWTKEQLSEDWVAFVSDYYHPSGRESSTYLNGAMEFFSGKLYAADHNGDIVLCQGNPFNHDKDFIAHLSDSSIRYYGEVVECNKNGAPHWYYESLDCWCKVFGLPPQDNYKFVAGAQYRLTSEQIQSRSHEFYEALLNLTEINDKSAWVLERLWPLIWDIKLP